MNEDKEAMLLTVFGLYETIELVKWNNNKWNGGAGIFYNVDSLRHNIRHDILCCIIQIDDILYTRWSVPLSEIRNQLGEQKNYMEYIFTDEEFNEQ